MVGIQVPKPRESIDEYLLKKRVEKLERVLAGLIDFLSRTNIIGTLSQEEIDFLREIIE